MVKDYVFSKNFKRNKYKHGVKWIANERAQFAWEVIIIYLEIKKKKL